MKSTSKYSKSLTKEINAFLKAYKEYYKPGMHPVEGIQLTDVINNIKGTKYKITKLSDEQLNIDNFDKDERLFENTFTVMNELKLYPSIEFIKTFHEKLPIPQIFWYEQSKETTDYVLENFRILGGFKHNVAGFFRMVILTEKQLDKIIKEYNEVRSNKIELNDFNDKQQFSERILEKYFKPENVFFNGRSKNIPLSYTKKYIKESLNRGNFWSNNDGGELLSQCISKAEYQKLYKERHGKIAYCSKYITKKFFLELLNLKDITSRVWDDFSHINLNWHQQNPNFDLEVFEKMQKKFPNNWGLEQYLNRGIFHKDICKKYRKKIAPFLERGFYNEKNILKQLKEIDKSLHDILMLSSTKRELKNFIQYENNKNNPEFFGRMFSPVITHMPIHIDSLCQSTLLKEFTEKKNELKQQYIVRAEKEIKDLDNQIKKIETTMTHE